MRIAVIIPTLNEGPRLRRVLRLLRQRGESAMVVVADCGSADATVAAARRAGVVVIEGEGLESRSAAMNAGARRVLGNDAADVLWFVHADSIPPPRWDAAIAAALERRRVVGGAFDFAWMMGEAPWWLRMQLWIISAINRARFRVTRNFFGDQGIFVTRTAFERVGGYPQTALMEDVLFCRQLRTMGRLKVAKGIMFTSPRRFVRHGPIRQALIGLYLLFATWVGLRPARVYAWYNRDNRGG
ncbi:MAG: glycosyltransferase [Planctomycetota bacterium]|jgi:glycosyltransferase involved in cell wall biosynthesis